MEEEVVARIDYNTGQETELKKEASLVEVEARALAVNTAEEYEAAVRFAQKIKTKIKAIEEFFKPIKDAANKAHKAITSKENEALQPLKNAESVVKAGLNQYQNEQERIRREAQRAAEKALQEERERQLAEAARLEAAGKKDEAEKMLDEAVSAETLSTVINVQSEAPKVSGAAVKKDYIVTVTNPVLVPIEINGCIIRPVDEAAIKRLVKATYGKIRIPGVSITETAAVSIRR